MLDLIKVIILGIVEGITEFLPISSTGHLIVATALLKPGFSESLSKTFEIVIQIGAIIAVVVFYRMDIWRQIKTVPTDRRVQHFWLTIVVAFLPAGVVGFLLRDFISEYLQDRPIIVAISLLVGGVAIIVTERYFSSRNREQTGTGSLYDITYGQALFIGVIQIISMIPGVSRAAASILGGMLCGLKRETATAFSFYLAIPTLGGATVLKLASNLKNLNSGDLLFLAVGTIVSGIVAWFAIAFLLRFISRNSFTGFGFYRIAAGLVILLLLAAAVL